jgi:hypothetical protein
MFIATGRQPGDPTIGSIQYSYDGKDWFNNTSGGFVYGAGGLTSTNVLAGPTGPIDFASTINQLRNALFFKKGTYI